MITEVKLLIYSYLLSLDEMLCLFEHNTKIKELLICRYYHIPTLSDAILQKKENVIKYLITAGYKFNDEDYNAYLSRISNINLLRWLYEHKIIFPINTIYHSATHAMFEEYKFFVSKGHIITDIDLRKALDGYYNYKELLKYETFSGYYTRFLDEIFNKYENILEYLLKSGARISDNDFEEIDDNDDKIIQLLQKYKN
jgi:hypothetical protein